MILGFWRNLDIYQDNIMRSIKNSERKGKRMEDIINRDFKKI